MNHLSKEIKKNFMNQKIEIFNLQKRIEKQVTLPLYYYNIKIKLIIIEIFCSNHTDRETHGYKAQQGVHRNYFQNSRFYRPKSIIFPGFRIAKGTFFQSKAGVDGRPVSFPFDFISLKSRERDG